jgi:hypothetical protein
VPRVLPKQKSHVGVTNVALGASSPRLFRELSEFLVELVDTTSRIHEFHLTGEKWVAVRGDLHFDQWVLVAVGPSSFFFCIGARAAKERIVGGNVLEYHKTIIFRMDTFFHINQL